MKRTKPLERPKRTCAKCKKPTRDYYPLRAGDRRHSKDGVACAPCHEDAIRRITRENS